LGKKAPSPEQILCNIARQHLQEHFARQRKNILRALLPLARNPGRSGAKKFVEDMKKISKVLKLNAHEAETLRTPYRENFQRLYRQFTSRLGASPPDWAGMAQVARQIFRTQDRLIAETFGQERLQRYRAHERRGRVALLSIFTRFAGLPWTQKNLAW